MRFSHLKMSSLKRSKNEWVILPCSFPLWAWIKMCNFDESSLTKTTSRGKFYLSVYCLLELKCQVVRAEIGFKMCRFPSVGSVDLRLAPLITFACGCHRSEKAASAHPTRKNAKSRLVEGSSRQSLVSTILWSENHYLYALSYLAIFFCLAQINLHDWFWGDFSTLFSSCKIDIPTTEATSVQFFHDGNYCQLSCHFNCLLTGLFQNCSQHISTHKTKGISEMKHSNFFAMRLGQWTKRALQKISVRI